MWRSTAGRYAPQAMVDLAQHQGQGPVLRKDIARRQEISSNYLAQLLVRLRRAGLIESVLGPGGGYVLAKPPVTAFLALNFIGSTTSTSRTGGRRDALRPDPRCPDR
jgi:Rrf2 family iron-sulfur cluster assembly transcriptional regulator